MLSKIKSLFSGESVGGEAKAPRSLELAAAALLVEAAILDGDFDDTERAVMARVLQERFQLSDTETAELIADAEAEIEASNELYTFSRILKDALDHEERVGILEMVWEVVLADGEVHHYESNLVRRLAGLLYIPDRESGEAGRRVRAKLEAG